MPQNQEEVYRFLWTKVHMDQPYLFWLIDSAPPSREEGKDSEVDNVISEEYVLLCEI